MTTKKEKYVVCAGSINMDIQGFAQEPLQLKDKNPTGKISLSSGGVVRNVGENLSRMGISVKLLSTIGDDIFGSELKQKCLKVGMDISHLQEVAGTNSSVQISLIDTDSNMMIGISDMSIRKNLSVEYFKSKHHLLFNADAVVLSPDIPTESMNYLCKHFSDKPIFIDVVSQSYANVISDNIEMFHTIKANSKEAEILAEHKIKNEADLQKAADIILNKGAERIVITLGSHGAYYKDKMGQSLRKKTRRINNLVSTIGAGDAFTAGLVYSFLNNLGISDTLDFSISASIITIKSEEVTSPRISAEFVNENISKWNLKEG